jgi:hypothetical protein
MSQVHTNLGARTESGLVDEIVLSQSCTTSHHGSVHIETRPNGIGSCLGNPGHARLVIGTIFDIEIIPDIALNQLCRLLFNCHPLKKIGHPIIYWRVWVLVKRTGSIPGTGHGGQEKAIDSD